MDTPTKQRLVGAAVLIALAVIFLPMLVKGPAPDSGVSDVPLDIPNQPPSGMETRDLPLVSPQAGDEGALATPAPPAGERLPTVDTADADAEPMQPPSVAGGDYAVHFGSYASRADAGTIVGQLRGSQLPGYSEQTTLNGRSAWRVRIGPYATRADAEAARLRAAHVRDDVGARVVVLDAEAGADAPASTAATASASQPVAKPAAATVKTEPLPVEAPAPKPPSAPVATAPASKPAAPVSAPAASGTGFAVQVGAFGNATEAGKLRDRLRAAGFTAFTETVNSDKGALTRVRVGPVLSRAEADQLRAQLSAKAGVSGIVRPHP
jgi:cell division septation protein DedD